MCWCTPLDLSRANCGREACVAPDRVLLSCDPVPAATRPAAPPSPGPRPYTLADAAAAVGLRMAPREIEAMVADVKANIGLLESCPRHRFEEALDPPGARLRVRWRCKVCAGTVDASAKLWYERGLAHAAR